MGQSVSTSAGGGYFASPVSTPGNNFGEPKSALSTPSIPGLASRPIGATSAAPPALGLPKIPTIPSLSPTMGRPPTPGGGTSMMQRPSPGSEMPQMPQNRPMRSPSMLPSAPPPMISPRMDAAQIPAMPMVSPRAEPATLLETGFARGVKPAFGGPPRMPDSGWRPRQPSATLSQSGSETGSPTKPASASIMPSPGPQSPPVAFNRPPPGVPLQGRPMGRPSFGSGGFNPVTSSSSGVSTMGVSVGVPAKETPAFDPPKGPRALMSGGGGGGAASPPSGPRMLPAGANAPLSGSNAVIPTGPKTLRGGLGGAGADYGAVHHGRQGGHGRGNSFDEGSGMPPGLNLGMFNGPGASGPPGSGPLGQTQGQGQGPSLPPTFDERPEAGGPPGGGPPMGANFGPGFQPPPRGTGWGGRARIRGGPRGRGRGGPPGGRGGWGGGY